MPLIKALVKLPQSKISFSMNTSDIKFKTKKKLVQNYNICVCPQILMKCYLTIALFCTSEYMHIREANLAYFNKHYPSWSWSHSQILMPNVKYTEYF